MCTIFVCQYPNLAYAIFVCQYFILVYKLSIKVIVKFCKKLKRNIFPKQGRRVYMLCYPKLSEEHIRTHSKKVLKENFFTRVYFIWSIFSQVNFSMVIFIYGHFSMVNFYTVLQKVLIKLYTINLFFRREIFHSIIFILSFYIGIPYVYTKKVFWLNIDTSRFPSNFDRISRL